ncbi:MAG: HAD-IIIA family hydrolase [Nostoc indistinguendum CM1-VF10]|jgi:HAD superfamily hydrolase (TIGR01662 family)|nr:HAD-IIIA family hydrolase [Nostoc indistinguendum CM1-VF10]
MSAIFLDKDGTLIENVPNNVDPQLIEMKIGAIEGLQILSKAGYKLIVITNQSGVAPGRPHHVNKTRIFSIDSKIISLIPIY